MNLAEFSIRNHLIMSIVIILSLVGGLLAYKSMPRFEDPEFVIRTAQIITEYPGASPLQVAEEVSEALESEIQSMQEVSEIRSTAYHGVSVIEVDIKREFSVTKSDLQIVWTRLRNRVHDAQRLLPPGGGPSIVNDDYGDVFGLYYLVTGEGFSLKELHDYAKDLRTSLLSVDGVAKIALAGERNEAIYVELSRENVAALGLSLENVLADLARQNSILAAGSVQIGTQRLQIQPSGNLGSLEDLNNVIVSGGASDKLIYLKDIAAIRRGYVEPPQYLTRYDGQPAIALGISNVTGANVAVIGEQIRAKLDALSAQRPLGIEVSEFYHQGDAVNQAVSSFVINVVAALGIVLITLFIFMGLRSAVIIGAVLVVTVAATLATMSLVGIPMHRISLGALIIALGMLVDNAIVVTEGVLVGIKSGRKKLEVAQEVVGRTKWALLGGTIVGILAFAPIGFAPGDTAEYTNHLFWVILISLLYSWIFALTLVPMIADLIFKQEDAPDDVAKADGKIISLYKRFMRAVLGYRWVVIGSVTALFAASIFGFNYVKEGFFPTSTTPQIAIDYWLPEGTDIAQTESDITQIETKISAMDGVEGLHSVIGAGALRYMLIYSPETPNSAYGQIIVKVDDIQKIASLMPQMQSYLDGAFPAAQSRVWRFQMGPSQGSKIEATFIGPDPKVLRELAVEAMAIVNSAPTATGVKLDWRQEVPTIVPQYNAERGRRTGVSREEMSSALNAHFSGRVLGVYREGDDLIPIINRAPESERRDLATGASIQILSGASGKTVPLSEIVDDVNIVWTDGQLRRENRIWTLKVQADPVQGVLTSDLLGQLRPQIEAISLPAEYELRWDGEYGDSQTANAELAQTLPMGLLAMVLVVVLLFNAIRQAIVIWLIVPLALIGVVVGLLVTGTALEFMAILGLLSLSGLLIKNAIVLVDQMGLEIKEGKPRHDAVIDSAVSRVRPVMMGSLTTIFGVIPLMWDVFFSSMAIVIVFGLAFATVLTLVVLPAIYVAIFKIRSSETADAVPLPIAVLEGV